MFNNLKLSEFLKFYFLGWLIVFSAGREEVFAQETYKFDLDFLFIPCVEIVMEISDTTDVRGQQLKKLDYYTRTRPLFNPIFQVNNTYKTVYHPETFQVVFTENKIEQSNLFQNISAEYSDNIVKYSNGSIRSILPGAHNIFSLLMHLRMMDCKQLDRERILVELAGNLYEAQLSYGGEEIVTVDKDGVVADKIEISLFLLTTGRSTVTEKTDIFHQRIGSPDSRKFIWIERAAPRRIVKAEFNLPPVWLVATLSADKDEVYP